MQFRKELLTSRKKSGKIINSNHEADEEFKGCFYSRALKWKESMMKHGLSLLTLNLTLTYET